MATKKLITNISQKTDDGDLGPLNYIGADFDNVVDNRSSAGNYTLRQFFDSYMNYMKNGTFVYAGPDKPENTHIALWFDTSGISAIEE